MFQEMIRQIQRAETISYTGKIENIVGMSIEASGGRAAVGDICQIYNGDAGGQVMAEVVGFKNDHILLMPYSDMSGISAGNFVRNTGRRLSLRMGPFLKGRVINALGQPIDGKGPFQGGTLFCVENNHYINPMTRPPIRERMEFGVKAIDSMLTIGKGQRIGIFAGSGVGKSTLMGMIAKNVKADINVIALVGERGREVLEFMEKDLGPEGMRRSILVVATSDQPAMLRKQCPSVATGIAEFFRDQGYDVLLMMDSLTRFAMAQREIGLAVGGAAGSRRFRHQAAATPHPSTPSCPSCWNAAVTSRRAPSQGSIPSWWRATTPMSPSRTRCAVFWMGTSCFPGGWPTATIFRPLTLGPASPA